MRNIFQLIIILLTTGCSSIEFAPNKVYRVTGGYTPGAYSHPSGDEFLFSISPPAGEWAYVKSKPWFRNDHARIEFESKKGKLVTFFWFWKPDIELERDAANIPYVAPWRSGAPAGMGRMPYIPTERQLKSGDWEQPGYRQSQWHDFRYFGERRYFCMTSLAKSREGLIEYGGVKQEPFNLYWYSISCPFRVENRRTGAFVVHVNFSITDQQFKEHPERVDMNIEFIDKMLEPSWNSLAVIPGAYQFKPSTSGEQPKQE